MKTEEDKGEEERRRGKEDGRDEEVSLSRPEYWILASSRVGSETIDSRQRCLPGMVKYITHAANYEDTMIDQCAVADLSLPAYLDN